MVCTIPFCQCCSFMFSVSVWFCCLFQCRILVLGSYGHLLPGVRLLSWTECCLDLGDLDSLISLDDGVALGGKFLWLENLTDLPPQPLCCPSPLPFIEVFPLVLLAFGVWVSFALAKDFSCAAFNLSSHFLLIFYPYKSGCAGTS